MWRFMNILEEIVLFALMLILLFIFVLTQLDILFSMPKVCSASFVSGGIAYIFYKVLNRLNINIFKTIFSL